MSIFSLSFGYADILKHLFTFQTLLILQKVSQQNQPGWWDGDQRTHPASAPGSESGDGQLRVAIPAVSNPHTQIPVCLYLGLLKIS